MLKNHIDNRKFINGGDILIKTFRPSMGMLCYPGTMVVVKGIEKIYDTVMKVKAVEDEWLDDEFEFEDFDVEIDMDDIMKNFEERMNEMRNEYFGKGL